MAHSERRMQLGRAEKTEKDIKLDQDQARGVSMSCWRGRILGGNSKRKSPSQQTEGFVLFPGSSKQWAFLLAQMVKNPPAMQ